MSQDPFIFCENILKKVSRSFALTIPMLDQVLYKPVLITYLQDRILDNFEDEIKDISLEERKDLMDKVVQLFNPGNENNDYLCSKLKEYASLMPDKPLQELTANVNLVKEAYNTLNEEIKGFSYKWLVEMNQGMKKYLTAEVETFEDLDEYCYYVAGTVGGFLTDTIIYSTEINKEDSLDLLDNFNQAGLFLQKINLIRDIKKDIKAREKNFWPMKELGLTPVTILDINNKEKVMQGLEKMLTDVKKHIPALITYLQALPQDLPGYRRFFCVNNALGLATIDKMENNPKLFYGRKEVKVSKLQFLNILKGAEKAFYQLVPETIRSI